MKFQKNKEPLVTVLITVFNRKFLIKEAISSILQQSYRNIELLIVNDGSTDGTDEILNEIKQSDNRVKVIGLKENIGIPKAANIGLKYSNGKYIARMDSDDISKKERIEKQVIFLEKNKDVFFCGTWKSLLSNDNELLKLPLEYNEIKAYAFWQAPFHHPTIMFRRKIFEDGNFYNEKYYIAHDYKLWDRLLDKYKAANIADALVYYRIHDDNISFNNMDRMLEEAQKVRFIQVEKLLERSLSDKEKKLHRCLFISDKKDRIDYKELDKWCKYLLSVNMEQNRFENNYFSKTMSIYKFKALRGVNNIPISVLISYLFFPYKSKIRYKIRDLFYMYRKNR